MRYLNYSKRKFSYDQKRKWNGGLVAERMLHHALLYILSNRDRFQEIPFQYGFHRRNDEVFIWSDARTSLLDGVKERQKIHQTLDGAGRRHDHFV